MIYFKEAQGNNITELLNSGFNNFFCETFSDKECTEQQCKIARRSFNDLLLICLTYFPKTTKEELAYVLLNNISRLVCFYCPNIDKLVFLKEGADKPFYFDKRVYSECDEEYVDCTGVCFNNILNWSKEYEKENTPSQIH